VSLAINPSDSRAWAKSSCTCVELASAVSTVWIQRRETTSTMAKASRRARRNSVPSQIPMQLGFQVTNSGHGGSTTGVRGGGSGSLTWCFAATRLTLEGETKTLPM